MTNSSSRENVKTLKTSVAGLLPPVEAIEKLSQMDTCPRELESRSRLVHFLVAPRQRNFNPQKVSILGQISRPKVDASVGERGYPYRIERPNLRPLMIVARRSSSFFRAVGFFQEIS